MGDSPYQDWLERNDYTDSVLLMEGMLKTPTVRHNAGIAKALRLLPAKLGWDEKKVLTMILKGLSPGKMAKQLKVSRMQIHRLRENIRKILHNLLRP